MPESRQSSNQPNNPAHLDLKIELSKLLESWNSMKDTPGADVCPILQQLAEMMERETEAFYRSDPDPFDDRHPGVAKPDCSLGVVLKNIYQDDEFMNHLVNDYVTHRDNVQLQTVACRVLYDLMPGLDASVVFNENENLVEWLLGKAESADEPLKSYTIGLLGAAMEVPGLAERYKDENVRLNGILLKRLKFLVTGESEIKDPVSDAAVAQQQQQPPPPPPSQQQEKVVPVNGTTAAAGNNAAAAGDVSAHVFERPFAVFTPTSNNHQNHNNSSTNSSGGPGSGHSTGIKRIFSPEHNNSNNSASGSHSFTIPSPLSKRRRISSPNSPAGSIHTESNSSWADLEPLTVGNYCLFPLTSEMQQRLILQYLTPMGNYQELLPHVFGEDAMATILQLIDLNKNQDIRLSFAALKYLSSLFCHKKFALDFLERGGLQMLLQVYRPSVAATGVALCLYCLVDLGDATEKICQMPKAILTELVNYSLWLLERSHETSKSNATMFFASTFAFRVILEIFDSQDGLRKLLNSMFILNLFEDPEYESGNEQQEDIISSKRQLSRKICVALKKYFEAHLFFESEKVRRITSSSSGGSSGNPGGRVARFKPEDVSKQLESLLELHQGRISWKPVNDFIELGGLKQIMTLITMAFTRPSAGRPDPIKSCLEVLVVASVVPRMQLKLRDKVENTEGDEMSAIRVLLDFLRTSETPGNEAAVTLRHRDPQGVSYAMLSLMIIINCVCEPAGPSAAATAAANGGQSGSKNILSSARKKLSLQLQHSHRNHQSPMWKCMLDNDGVCVLLNLLKLTIPVNEAYSIRCLACRALCGLSNCEEIRQILSKLPMFTCGMLQNLMKKPVLQYNEADFNKFVRYGKELMHRVTGAPIELSIENTVDNVSRAEVVAQTKITFNEEQLMQLMHDYLSRKGLTETAAHLLKEAKLSIASSQITHRPFPITTPKSKRNAETSFSCPATPSAASSHSVAVSLSSAKHPALSSSQSMIMSSPVSSQSSAAAAATTAGPTSSQASYQSSSQGSSSVISNSSPVPSGSHRRSQSFRVKTPNPDHHRHRHQSVKHASANSNNNASKSVTLESIVREYLRNQHSKCSNPIITCPPFDILTRHKCPESTRRSEAPRNMAMRICRKEILPKYGGPMGRKFDRKFVYSKFCPVKTFRDSGLIIDEDQSFTTCAFAYPSENRTYAEGELGTPPYLFVGTSSGKMATFNLDTGLLANSYDCHSVDIRSIEPARDGRSIITSCTYGQGDGAAILWSFTDEFKEIMNFEDNFHVEFGKRSQDKAIGTEYDCFKLYDLTKKNVMATFNDDTENRKFYETKATFNYTDELVVWNSLLWDVRAKNVIHKFSKFDSNNTVNWAFHPNGWEIIANSYIWDMRTYRLLKTVPALDQCKLKFNSTGDVIYGGQLWAESNPEEGQYIQQESSFRTFDATDYSSIATIDIKHTIHDLAVDHKDHYIAIIEQTVKSEFCFNMENVCKLYEIGRSKEEDEEGEDDDEDDDDGSEDVSHSDSDDDEDLLDATDDFDHGWNSSDYNDSEGLDESDDDSDDDSNHSGIFPDGDSDDSENYEDVSSDDEDAEEDLSNWGFD